MSRSPPVFTAAPHRMMFLGGTVQLVAVLALWAAELIARHLGGYTGLPLVVPPTWAHALLMLYTLFPFFIFGFLMTTYPRWMNGEPLESGAYAPAFGALAAGTVVTYAGLFTDRALLVLGVGLLLAGWGAAFAALWRVYRSAPAPDKRHETSLNLALACGWLGLLAYVLWLVSGHWVLLRISLEAGLWLFLVPLLVTVCHRMIPFFSSNVIEAYRVIQPRWSLPLLWAALALRVLLSLAGQPAWLWLPDAALAFMALHHSLSWGLRASFTARLLAMLHVAFFWFALAMVLYLIRDVAWVLDRPGFLGRAPLHALGIGFMTSLAVGMATRVTLGHSGRALEVDAFTWACFWGVGLAALVRMAAELPASLSLSLHLNLAAALVWLASLVPWVARHAPMYLRPRADGRPG